MNEFSLTHPSSFILSLNPFSEALPMRPRMVPHIVPPDRSASAGPALGDRENVATAAHRAVDPASARTLTAANEPSGAGPSPET
jgi:hypothetical protein